MEQPCKIPSIHRHRPILLSISLSHSLLHCARAAFQAHTPQLWRPQRLQDVWKLHVSYAAISALGNESCPHKAFNGCSN